MADDQLERHLTLREIGELLGASQDWARRAWKRGEFGTRYIDMSLHATGHEPRIPESAVQAYIRRRTYTLPVIKSEVAAVG